MLTFNILNNNDIVTHLPPVVPAGFRRHGTDISATMTSRSLTDLNNLLLFMPKIGVPAWVISDVFNHHPPGFYHYWMMSNQVEIVGGNVLVNGGRRDIVQALPQWLEIDAPVDITFYGVQNHEFETLSYENEVRQIFVPSGDDELILRFTAISDGEFTFTVSSIDASLDTPVEQIVFENVTLYDGRELMSELTATQEVRLLIIEDDEVIGEILEDGTEVIFATDISITPPAVQSLEIGDTYQLTAIITPSTATNQNVTWSSSAPNVATVSATGLVTAIAGGEAVITARTEDGEHMATIRKVVLGDEDDGFGDNGDQGGSDDSGNQGDTGNQGDNSDQGGSDDSSDQGDNGNQDGSGDAGNQDDNGTPTTEYTFTTSDFRFNWNHRTQITADVLLTRGNVSAFNTTENRSVNYRLRVDAESLSRLHNSASPGGTYPVTVTLIPASEYYNNVSALITPLTRTVNVTLYAAEGNETGNNNNNDVRKPPATGDTANMFGHLVAMTLASVLIGALVVKRRKRD